MGNKGRQLAKSPGLGRLFCESADTFAWWREEGHPEWRLAVFLADLRQIAELIARQHEKKDQQAGRTLAPGSEEVADDDGDA